MSKPTNFAANYGESGTPLVPSKHLLRPRNLTKQSTNQQQNYIENAGEEQGGVMKGKWDEIESPQCIDFHNIPSVSDSFFDYTVAVSTPRPNTRIAEEFRENQDETLVKSLNNFSISIIECASPLRSHNLSESAENSEQNNTIKFVERKASTPVKHDNHAAVSIETKPFTFGNRGKPNTLNTAGVAGNRPTTGKEVYKKRVAAQNFTEETKPQPFKANPVPKFLKNRPPLVLGKTARVNDPKTDINGNLEKKKFQVSKATTLPEVPKEEVPSTSKKMNLSDKPRTKRTEIWNRKPFIPQPTRTKPLRPQSPKLLSAKRAIERQRFEDSLQVKERQRERMKQLEELAKKQREEKEIAQLRELTVHKAQPIRKYKEVPQVPKRPLTDPVTPALLKRRRYK